MRPSHAQTSPQNTQESTGPLSTCAGSLSLLYVRLQSQSSSLVNPLAWGLPGLGDGIHIAPEGESEVTLRETSLVEEFI